MLGVLAQMIALEHARGRRIERSYPLSTARDTAPAAGSPEAVPAAASTEAARLAVPLAQPMLRAITVVMGWTAVLSNSVYGRAANPRTPWWHLMIL